jgi:preprotein translocase subunit SecD
MKPSPLWKAVLFLLASLPAGTAFASPQNPQKVELHMTLQVHGEGAAPASPREAARTAEILHSRLDRAGAGDPRVEAKGDRISIRAVTDDPDRIRRLLLARPQLEFRFVRFPATGGANSREEILAHFGGNLPPDLEVLEGDRTLYYAVEKKQAASGEGIESARPTQGYGDQPVLEFKLNPRAAAVFGEMTGANVGSALAIVLNGKVVAAPVIRSRITDMGMIEGSFTKEDVTDLATVLSSGTLTAPLTVLEETQGPPARKRSTGFLLLFFLLVLFVLLVAGSSLLRRRRRGPASTLPPV